MKTILYLIFLLILFIVIPAFRGEPLGFDVNFIIVCVGTFWFCLPSIFKQANS